MRLRLTEGCPQGGYNGITGSWVIGQEKDVDEAEGVRLLGTFPEWFERVDSPKAPPAIEESPAVSQRQTKPGKGKGK